MEGKHLTIVKVGTQTLLREDGTLREGVLQGIVSNFARESAAGRRMMLVTSGAVRLGRKLAGDANLPRAAAASVGQPALYAYYAKEAEQIGAVTAEILLSRPYLVRREQFLNLQKTFEDLFSRGILPIVNENDAAVADTDWSFGDNDGLAAALAISLDANRLVLMTHLEGLYDEDPHINPNAKLVEEIDNLSDEFLKYCSPNASSGGRGGMLSKLQAARICTAVGIEVRILNGMEPKNLETALSGGSVGTLCKARKMSNRVSNRDRWILAAKSSAGSIEIDDGAVGALRQGKSLLSVGIRKSYGQFERGDVIEVVGKDGRGVAYGIIDFSTEEMEEMLKTKSVHDKQAIHADNIFLLL